MGRVPMLLPTLGLMAGILLAPFPWWLAVISGALGVVALWLRHYPPGAFLLFCCISMVNVNVRDYPYTIAPGIYSFSGVPITLTATSGGATRAVVDIDSLNGISTPHLRAAIYLPPSLHDVDLWHTIEGTAHFSPIVVNSPIPFVADYERRLLNMGVAMQAIAESDNFHSGHVLNTPRGWARHANAMFQQRLASSNVNYQTFCIIDAIVLGNATEFPRADRNVYSSAGLSHLLALSGTHVALLSSLILIILWPLYVARRTTLRLLLTIVILWAYAFLTGLSPSVLRSVIMATTVMALRICQRRQSPLNTLALAAFIILLLSPRDIYTIGFQLSFLAVLGIILYYPLINPPNLSQRHLWLHRLWSYPAICLSAVLFTSFASVYHFHTFPVYFLLANLLVFPLVPVLMVSGIMVVAFPHIPIFVQCASWCTSALNWVSLTVASSPQASIGSLYPPLWYAAASIVLLTVAALGVRSNRFAFAACSLILLMASSLSLFHEPDTSRVELYRHTAFGHETVILRQDDTIYLATSAKHPSSRRRVMAYYTEILADYISQRAVVTVRMLPPGSVISDRQIEEDCPARKLPHQ